MISGSLRRRHFQLDSCSDKYENSRHRCYRWSFTESNNETVVNTLTTLINETRNCPCYENAAIKDIQFFQAPTRGDNCYETIFPTTGVLGYRVQDCFVCFVFIKKWTNVFLYMYTRLFLVLWHELYFYTPIWKNGTYYGNTCGGWASSRAFARSITSIVFIV